MKTDKIEDKIIIDKLHLEVDNNKMYRLILTDSDGQEWCLGHQPVCFEGGGMVIIEKKKDSFYFKKKIS